MNREDIEQAIYERTRRFVSDDVMDAIAYMIGDEREACAKIAEMPIGEYEVVVACGTEPTPSRIPQYANWQDIAKAIRERGQS